MSSIPFVYVLRPAINMDDLESQYVLMNIWLNCEIR